MNPEEQTKSNPRRIGLVAGWGRYPIYLAKTLKEAGHEVYGLGVINHVAPEFKDYCDVFSTVGLGKMRKAVNFFRKHGISEVTMAGKIHKKLLFEQWFFWKHLPDLLTIRTFAPHFLTRKKDSKDDSLLMTVVNGFDRFGIKFLPGTDFAPELLVKRQKLTRRGPSANQWKDICFGWEIAREMGRLDIGQSIAVKNSAILAVEAIEGTDECIRRAGSLCPAAGFTVVKISKPKQDMRFDVPTFGLLTMQTMLESGATVLAIEAGKTIFIDKQEVVDFADAHNIVIVSITEDDTRNEKSPFPEYPPEE